MRFGADVRLEAERLLRMVTSADEEGRAHRGAPTDLVALAGDALMRTRRAARDDGGHHITAELPDSPLIAHVDADGVLRALSNLLGNARAYAPPGSTIHLGLVREAGCAAFSVRDEGMGIAAADLGRVTRPGFRAPAAVASGVAGSGLGLAVVQRVAATHDGSLEIVTAPGEGSTFTLRLPLAAG